MLWRWQILKLLQKLKYYQMSSNTGTWNMILFPDLRSMLMTGRWSSTRPAWWTVAGTSAVSTPCPRSATPWTWWWGTAWTWWCRTPPLSPTSTTGRSWRPGSWVPALSMCRRAALWHYNAGLISDIFTFSFYFAASCEDSEVLKSFIQVFNTNTFE